MKQKTITITITEDEEINVFSVLTETSEPMKVSEIVGIFEEQKFHMLSESKSRAEKLLAKSHFQKPRSLEIKKQIVEDVKKEEQP